MTKEFQKEEEELEEIISKEKIDFETLDLEIHIFNKPLKYKKQEIRKSVQRKNKILKIFCCDFSMILLAYVLLMFSSDFLRLA